MLPRIHHPPLFLISAISRKQKPIFWDSGGYQHQSAYLVASNFTRIHAVFTTNTYWNSSAPNSVFGFGVSFNPRILSTFWEFFLSVSGNPRILSTFREFFFVCQRLSAYFVYFSRIFFCLSAAIRVFCLLFENCFLFVSGNPRIFFQTFCQFLQFQRGSAWNGNFFYKRWKYADKSASGKVGKWHVWSSLKITFWSWWKRL